MFLGGSKKGKTIFLCSVDLVVQGNNFLAPKEGVTWSFIASRPFG